MKCKAFILFALVLLASSAFAEEKSQHYARKLVAQGEINANEAKPAYIIDTAWTGGGGGGGYGGGGGGGGGSGGGSGWSKGYSHGGAYKSGHHCHFGCCSHSSGWSLGGGGYATCTCCHTAAEAKAYKEMTQAKPKIKN
ncbi:hypothetical protein ACJIZ3_023235 [Penstemon smallii]|uniref:Glycine-rich protein n=1 Tax=Penstemon smallii TaxID=265156 RepID=A0ABD3TNI2_9LAMI